MTISPYKLRIFGSPDEIGAAPKGGGLNLSGLSVMTYLGLRLRREALQKASQNGLLPEVTGDKAYTDKLRPGSGLIYTALLPAGTLAPVVAAAAGASPGPISQSLIWFDPEYALAVIPLIFSVPRAHQGWSSITMARPLGVDELLGVLNLLTQQGVATSLARQAADVLQQSNVLHPKDILQLEPVIDAMGLQLWDLEGSFQSTQGSLRPSKPYEAVAESKRYAWEISAFMSYSSDHVIKDRLWLNRSQDQVYSEVAEGFTALGDHMVFVNHSCCLEISHLPGNLRERSAFRMQNYGYDSSSIFVWTVANLRSMVLYDLRDRYRKRITGLVERQGLAAQELAALAKDELRHYALIDRLITFRDQLKEPRNRRLDEEVFAKRFSHDPVAPLRRDMEKAEALAADLVKARDQALQQNTNTLLAVLAVALALIGVPGLVEQVAEWSAKHQWQRLGVSAFVIVIVFTLLTLIWRRRV